jgi:hypothetical protein
MGVELVSYRQQEASSVGRSLLFSSLIRCEKGVPMLFKIDVEGKRASQVKHGSLADWQLRERYDLQEWILHNPELLGEELLIVTSEFSGFDKTAERLDVLALDKEGVLTVVELKRSALGTAAELQALRYAAYCSTMSLKDVTELMAEYESKRSKTEITATDAERRIKEFINERDFAELADKPRAHPGGRRFLSRNNVHRDLVAELQC